MFGFLIEEVRLVVEKRTKEQQLRGLSRTTGHIGNVDDPAGGYVEKDPLPRRTKPAPKRGYDPHPDNIKAHRARERDSAKQIAQAVAHGSRFTQGSRGVKTIKALRALRDKPSKIKARKAEAARRLPIKFPKGNR